MVSEQNNNKDALIKVLKKYWGFEEFRDSQKKIIDLVHNKKQVIYGWTINDEENSKSLTSMGLDGVITDYPNIIKK